MPDQAPVIGRWSDAYGRKPFLVLSFTCGGAQVVALLLYITMGTSLFWYFPAQVCALNLCADCSLLRLSICQQQHARDALPLMRGIDACTSLSGGVMM